MAESFCIRDAGFVIHPGEVNWHIHQIVLIPGFCPALLCEEEEVNFLSNLFFVSLFLLNLMLLLFPHQGQVGKGKVMEGQQESLSPIVDGKFKEAALLSLLCSEEGECQLCLIVVSKIISGCVTQNGYSDDLLIDPHSRSHSRLCTSMVMVLTQT